MYAINHTLTFFFGKLLSKFPCYDCVVPENIHTSTMEGISYRTPNPGIFHLRYFWSTPHPHSFRIHPHPPLEKFSFERIKSPQNKFGVNISEISRTTYTRRKSALWKSVYAVEFHRWNLPRSGKYSYCNNCCVLY